MSVVLYGRDVSGLVWALCSNRGKGRTPEKSPNKRAASAVSDSYIYQQIIGFLILSIKTPYKAAKFLPAPGAGVAALPCFCLYWIF
jgi:hypothetical protein